MDHYDLTAPGERDLDAIVELYRACDSVDAPGTVSGREDVAWRWRTSGFDRDRDAWVVRRGNSVAAYAWVFEGLADVRVHPAERGRGLGSRLLELVERRAAAQGSRDGFLRQNVTNLTPGAQALLESRGYVYSHHYALLAIDLDERPRVPAPPEGVIVRTYELGPDDGAVHRAFNRAWSQYEGERWEPEPFERWMENVESEDFDPAHWHLALEAGEVVGFCLGERYGDHAWIQSLGTVPEQRGRGLGRLLLTTGFAAFHDAGVRRVDLTCSSENIPAARALYDSAGMREVLRYENLKRPIESLRAVFSS
ncbi:MAG TPA: GNAT family N-acetyltransferase [Actinomycetota bacterium]|nr:GNAT family N-acetyltransferase [Actinomycetota bacterium]